MKMRWRCSVSRVALSYEQVNPYTFAEPTSPHIISAGRAADCRGDASRAARTGGLADWVLGGAGGWFTPLSEP
jgi:dethiobiotin synthetase